MDRQELSSHNGEESMDQKPTIRILQHKHFVILLISSLGLYGIWWMFKTWMFFRKKEGSNIIPAARAIFGIVFFYSLCDVIKKFAIENGHSVRYNSLGLTVLYITCCFLGKLPDPYGIVAIGASLFLIPPFKVFTVALKSFEKVTVIQQNSFNGRQLTTLIVGTICWILVILGLLFEYSSILE